MIIARGETLTMKIVVPIGVELKNAPYVGGQWKSASLNWWSA